MGFSQPSGLSPASGGGAQCDGAPPDGQPLQQPGAPPLAWRLIIRSAAAAPITTPANFILVCHKPFSFLYQP